jgi:hypothetical protein
MTVTAGKGPEGNCYRGGLFVKRIFLAVLLIIGVGMVPFGYGMAKYIPEGSNIW